jgi:hypothetical protein
VLIRFDAELRFTLDAPERRTGINAALQKGQLCVSPSIDGPHRSFSPADLYPDMLPSGVFAARLDGNVLVVRLKGDAELDVTSYAADPEFQSCVAAGAPVLVSMCDADFEPLVIDGGDAGPYPAGNLVPPSAAAAGAPAAARKPAGTKRAAGKKSGSTVDPLASALELVLTAEAELPSLVTRLLKSGEAADYQVERALEGITTALSEHSGTIEASLAKRSSAGSAPSASNIACGRHGRSVRRHGRMAQRCSRSSATIPSWTTMGSTWCVRPPGSTTTEAAFPQPQIRRYAPSAS